MSCPHSEGTYSQTEPTSEAVTVDGKQCTKYGMIHIDVCSMCDQEIARRTSWGQTVCP